MFPGSLFSLFAAGSYEVPPSDIEFIDSSQGVVNSGEITLPTHATGDLLVMVAVNIGGSDTPTAPGDEGWTNEASASRTGFGAKNFRTYSKIAESGSVTTAAWGELITLFCHVYRNASGLGAGATGNSGASNPDIPGLTLEVSDGSSWVMAWVGQNGSATSVLTNNTGSLTRREVYAPGGVDREEFVSWDTDGGVSSFSQKDDINTEGNLDWISLSVEILKATS